MDLPSEAVWFLIGLMVMLLELAAPGGVLVFFGAAAWITAFAVYIGLADSMELQLVIFSTASASLFAGLRKWLRGKFFQEEN